MKKPFNNQDRARLKHLAEMVEQKRHDTSKEGQGKDMDTTTKQKKSLASNRFFQRRN